MSSRRFMAWRPACVALVLCALTACASGPPPATWRVNASDALGRAREAYLVAEDRSAQAELARARAEASRTGSPLQLARIELSVCAWARASLVGDDCPAFEPLRPDVGEAERAYMRYLRGQPLSAAELAVLPEAHRSVAIALSAGASAGVALAAVADPLSRLVAAGAAFAAGRSDPTVIELAIETASERGWRRPLRAWLQAQLARAQAAGASAQAEALQRRIRVLEQAR